MVTKTGLLRRNQDFRRFWFGHTASVAGTHITAVALPLLATLTLDAGAAGVAAIATATFLPNLLLSLFVGHWLELRRRRQIMVVTDIVRAVALAAVPAAYLVDLLSVPLLVVVAFVVGAASVVFELASFAYVPTLVDEEDLPAANQATQGSTTAAQVAGPGLAGGLAQLVGPAMAVALDAVSYVLSAFGVAGARRPEPAPPPVEGRRGILEGLRAVAVNPFLRSLATYAAVYNGAFQILTVNLVVFAVTDRGLNAGMFGLALSAAGAGAFVGTMLALRLTRGIGYGRGFIVGMALSCGFPLLIPVLPGDGGVLAFGLAAIQFVSGIGLGIANVLSVTLRQIVVPRGSLARTNAGYRLLIYGVLPLGSAAGGFIGQAAGSRVGVAAGAVGLALSGLPMLTRRMRTMKSPYDVRPPAPPTASAPVSDSVPTKVTP
ncbi:MFS transporter [Polymorphospora rubra]|uniref:MFS transporter n=1 Tax=Polymorphospora rubra TaxID=338584 RepID=A0A810N7L8_9ACTN|nr:MFS transporter [Polymorphospora rubra]BCJ67633.1 MFS transporter [Polymorphospora rubra]